MNNNHLTVSKISSGGTAKVSASSGKVIYVTAIQNGHTSEATVTFADDANLDAVTMGRHNGISFSAPIVCQSFTPGHASISVFYSEGTGSY